MPDRTELADEVIAAARRLSAALAHQRAPYVRTARNAPTDDDEIRDRQQQVRTADTRLRDALAVYDEAHDD